ncbi:MAG: YopX family protein [Eubacteriales bacterium]|nr:YopX family protein [Eubacteriales bacterium]
MEKIILFRGRLTGDGRWAEGFYIGGCEKEYIVSMGEKEMIPGQAHWNEIAPGTLCRYTGMKDRSGQRIWEHDIVKAYEVSSREWMTNEVVFEYGCFRLTPSLGFSTIIFWSSI